MTRIRKSPSMTGSFAEVAQEFIQYKRSTGFKYADEPKCLSRFCRFSEEQGVTEIKISRSLAETPDAYFLQLLWVLFHQRL